MKLKTILAAAIIFISIPSFGQSNITETTLEVDGLCGMCKKRIENAAYIQGRRWSGCRRFRKPPGAVLPLRSRAGS